LKEKKTKADSGNHQKKTTKGKVDGLDRGIWYYLKKKHGVSEQKLVQLKEALYPARISGNPATLVRIFDPDLAKEKGVTIADYEKLNEYPELILFEGYYHGRGKTREMIIEKKSEAGPSLLEQKIKEGAITEAGIVLEKTSTQKWIGRIGNFMMMGGFLLVLLLVVAIVVLVSIFAKGC
jgi:hypothetical protein